MTRTHLPSLLVLVVSASLVGCGGSSSDSGSGDGAGGSGGGAGASSPGGSSPGAGQAGAAGAAGGGTGGHGGAGAGAGAGPGAGGAAGSGQGGKSGVGAYGGSAAGSGHAGSGHSGGAGGKAGGGAGGATSAAGAAGANAGAAGAAAPGGAGGTSDAGGASGAGGASDAGGASGAGGASDAGGSGDVGGASGAGGASAGAGGAGGTAASGGSSAGPPAGWLYTSGSKIYVSDGSGSGAPWMGRGVNLDDIFLCGYDNTLWMPNADQTLETMISGLMSDWKPSFVRISLGMASYPTVTSWVGDPAPYKTPMTNVINSIGTYPNVYALVSLRSDASMIGQDMVDGDPEATGLPSDSTTTPDAAQYPTGTDATYVALVDSFANASFVLFGLTNEPGGNKLSNAQISAAMSHAVGVIRAEEDKLGVPHHIVSVQGNGWTSDISFYADAPLPYDNVVYEVHGYPPSPASYTHSTLPVILGEYGTLAGDGSAFFQDVEAKQIPNLAWDFESFSGCSPDLLEVNQSASNLVPSAWGSEVKSYLLAHP